MNKTKLISLFLVVAMLAAMVLAIVPASAAETPTADPEWYTRETTDATPTVLEIDNAAELLAFATELNNGKDYKDLTVKLTTNITLNEGFDAKALNAVTAYDDVDDAPAVVWPLKAGNSVTFDGEFDGQGFVLSGIYHKTTGAYTGLFGNVAKGDTATVKNLIVLNSFIMGNGQAVGTIFGGIDDPAYLTTDVEYGNDTSATIDNVYLDTVVANAGNGNTNLGTGGFVGGTRAPLTVTNSAFVGTVYGGVRGVGAIAGQVRSLETNIMTNGEKQPDGKNVFPTRANVTVTNCYLAGHLVGANTTYASGVGFQSFVGGIVGYMNNVGDHMYATNVVLNNTFGTRIPDGTLVSDSPKDPYEDPNKRGQGGVTETRKVLYLTGYVYGGAWGAKNLDGDGVTTIYQTWTMQDVFYVRTADPSTPDMVEFHQPVAKVVPDAKWTINGTAVNLTEYATQEIPGVSSYTQTDIPLWTMDGELAKNNAGNQIYAYSNEEPAQQLMNNAWADYALDKEDVADDSDWEDFIVERGWTETWTVYSGMPMTKSLANMLDKNEAADIQSDEPAADANWFVNETTDATPNELVIYNADDLLAFGAKLAEGETFEGKTVVLNADITVNATLGTDAVAWTANASASFAGTFNGNAMTISGVSATTAFFGNVAAAKTATVKDLEFKNSNMAGLFGTVSGTASIENVWVTANVTVASGNAALMIGEVASGATATVANSAVSGTVSGTTAGSVVAVTAGTLTLNNVLSTADVNGTTAGGAIGQAAGTLTVTNYLANGAVTGTTKGFLLGKDATTAAATWTLTNIYVAGSGNAVGTTGSSTASTNTAITATPAADLAGVTMDGWVKVGAYPMPETVYNMFYDGFVGQSISLSRTIAYNVYVKLASAIPVPGSFKVNDGDAQEIYSSVGANGVHCFTLPGFKAEQMVDQIAFEVEGADGMYTVTSSIKAYAVELLEVDAGLASALLRWGAAAQTYANYKTNALATAGVEGMTAEADTTAGLTNDATREGTASEEYFVETASLFVDNGVLKMSVKMRFQSITELECLMGQTADKDVIWLTFQNIAEVEDENRMYTVIFSDFDISNMNDVFTFVQKLQPRQSADALGQTYKTDMNDLVADFMASDASANDKALVKAMHAVGVALAD